MKLLAATLAVLVLLAAPAAASVYRGTHGAHGTLSFELSGDGQRVIAYSIDQARGDTCEFVAAGARGVWAGAMLTAGVFSYRLDDVIELDGRVDGNTATGTLRLRRHRGATHPACDSGEVCWSAATPGVQAPPLCPAAATPTPQPGPPSGRPPATPAPEAALRRMRSGITVKRTSRRFSGRIRSGTKACRAQRTVALMHGHKPLARTRSKANGSFSFRRTSRTRARKLRVVVAQRPVAGGVCTTAVSKLLRG